MAGTRSAALWASREAKQRRTLGHFPNNVRPWVGASSEIALDVVGIGRLKNFDPLPSQIHEIDMEFDRAVAIARADAVLAVHGESNRHLGDRAHGGRHAVLRNSIVAILGGRNYLN
jgi:hypothetical protein